MVRISIEMIMTCPELVHGCEVDTASSSLSHPDHDRHQSMMIIIMIIIIMIIIIMIMMIINHSDLVIV